VRARISTEIVDAITELRRRGDTIVRRRDLHAVLPLVDERERDAVDPDAWRRLDRAQWARRLSGQSRRKEALEPRTFAPEATMSYVPRGRRAGSCSDRVQPPPRTARCTTVRASRRARRRSVKVIVPRPLAVP
jgi:hypothetical protein